MTLLALPLPPATTFAEYLYSRRFSRDFYADLTTRAESNFFGRTREIAALLSAARRGAHISIAGLRNAMRSLWSLWWTYRQRPQT
jgi:hypothetical protein